MKSRKKNLNKGYSMVEMIIVMCIIGILTAASFVTLRSVDSAKYKKAVSTLESEMTTLRTTTMAQDSRTAMRLYLGDDGSYYIERGYCEGGIFHAGAPTGIAEAAQVYYNYSGVSSPVRVLSRGSLTYDGVAVDATGVVIRYNKSDGSIDSANGAGEYCLYRRNGELIANVHLNRRTGRYYETY